MTASRLAVATSGGTSVVASYPGTDQTVARLARLLPGAVAAVESFWGADWPRRAVVVPTAAPAEFAALADHVLTAMHVSPAAELNIMFIDPEPMEELHVRWLDLPGPTDVMSFPMDELRPGTADSPTPAGTLGDIVLCPQVAEIGTAHV